MAILYEQQSMARAYSNDLRRKLLEAHERGEGSLRELAGRFGVSGPWAWNISAQRLRTGQTKRVEQRYGPRSKVTGGGGRPMAFLDSEAARLDAGRTAHRQAQGGERSRTAAAALGETAVSDQHRAAVGCAPGTATATQKKSLHAQEQETPEARERRQAWLVLSLPKGGSK